MNNKIAFITCVSDIELYNQCLKYINNLNIPDGYSVETIKMEDSSDILSGYNNGMTLSDAKFKVYLLQDTLIINRNFIFDIIDIFNDKLIGMIGIVGTEKLPTSAIWREGKKCYGKVYESSTGEIKLLEFNEVEDKTQNVEAIDGLIMATQYDLTWREDIFKGSHFYDISQSFEFKMAGYKVVVPKQDKPWCKYYGEINRIDEDYNKDRIKFEKEYFREIYYNRLLKLSDNSEEIFKFDRLKAENKLKTNYEKMKANEKFIVDLFIDEKVEQCIDAVLKLAYFPINNPTGSFTSKVLEYILLDYANHLQKVNLNDQGIRINNNKNKKKILHILSEGYSVGGHTRIVDRWIKKDKESMHYLVTTWQCDTLPQWLLDTLVSNGGQHFNLADYSKSYMDRASILKEVSMAFDIIILHSHMNDPIPIIAFGNDGGAPVVLLNHADHVFWLGSSVADKVASIRNSGLSICKDRRGIEENIVLPIPIDDDIEFAGNDIELRKRLNIPEHDIIITSVATEYKFSNNGDVNIEWIIYYIMKLYNNVTILLVGPDGNSRRWKTIEGNCDGKVKALGIVKNIESIYSITDIYLDSFPIGSLTSALDAAIKGKPVVGFFNKTAPILSIDAPSLIDYLHTDIDSYINELNLLITNQEYRFKKGKEMQKSVYEYHILNWKHYLQDLYKSLPKNHKIKKIKFPNYNYADEDLLFLTLIN